MKIELDKLDLTSAESPVDGRVASFCAQQQEAQKDFWTNYSSEGVGAQPVDVTVEAVEVTII